MADNETPGTIIYNKSPNVQIADDAGVLRRAQLVAAASGDIRFNDPDNSPNVEVMCDDGQYHRAQLVAMVGMGSTLEQRIIIKSDTIPAADGDSYGKFYCFSGATNNTYTHGYIYECIADVSTEYIIALNKTEEFEINKLGFDYEHHSPIELFERIASLSTPTFNASDVKSGSLVLDKANELWYVNGYDASNNLLFEDFTIAATGDENSLDAYGFVYIDHFPDNFEEGYTEEYELNSNPVYSNYRWVRLDVQPAAALGRYLSNWNAATGLAVTNPSESPYTYKSGDYYIVSNVASSGSTNYRPSGSSYVIGTASTTVESSPLSINDTYLYDGISWLLLKTSSGVNSVNGQTGDVILSINDVAPTQTGYSGRVLGTDGFVAGWVQPEIVQRDTMPQAAQEEENNIYQYIGTTNANYTNGYFYKCSNVASSANVTQSGGLTVTFNKSTFETQITTTGVYVFKYSASSDNWSDSNNNVVTLSDYGISYTGIPINGDTITVDYTAADYAWNQTDVQPQVDSLPDQTGNSGKFLVTDGTNASWDNTIYRTGQNNLGINFVRSNNSSQTTFLSIKTSNTAINPLNILWYNYHDNTGDIYLRTGVQYADRQWVFTNDALYQYKVYSVQNVNLGTSTAPFYTLYIKQLNNGLDITVPTTGGTMVVATPPSVDGTYVLKATVADGAVTYTWVAE